MIGKPECRTTVGCCLPYIIKRSALSVFAQIGMRMKITEHKKSIAVSLSNVKLPPGKRIRDSLYIPRRIIGCPPRVSPLCGSNGHPAYNSVELDLFI